jgi:hypothetical protein
MNPIQTTRACPLKPQTKVNTMSHLKHILLSSLAALSLALTTPAAQAHQEEAALSEASALSLMPLALSMTAPIVLAVGVSTLTVVTVTVLADGTVWVLQRASDGAKFVVKLSAGAVGAASVAAGTVLTVTAVSAGWVLSAAGEVLALIPNTLGQALLHHERVIK